MQAALHPLRKLAECPPWLVYALALTKTGRMRPTLQQLSKESGIPWRTIIRLKNKKSWDGVKMGLIVKFLKACRVDPWNFRPQKKYLSNHRERLPHLTTQQWRAFNANCDAMLKGE